MQQLLVRNVDSALKRRIERAARANHRSMQAELLDTLESVYRPDERKVVDILREAGRVDGADFTVPERHAPRHVDEFE